MSSDASENFEADVFAAAPATLAPSPSPAPDFHELSAIALTTFVEKYY
ncbi:MAG: hypothetical protein RBJ76_04265 [Stenomitos frigidus ULC029]